MTAPTVRLYPRRAGDPYRFPLVSAAQRAARPPLVWAIDRTVPEYAAGQIVGPSYAGKTYVALDLALRIANPVESEWFGHEVLRHGPVVYLVMEGALEDIDRRTEAWVAAHPGTTADDLWTVEYPSIDVHKTADVLTLTREIVAQLGDAPAGVFIDTQSRAARGARENDNDDVTLVFDNLARMAVELRCPVLTIHHTGKTGDDSRGASSQFGAADLEIKVGRGTVRASKIKAAKEWETAAHFEFVGEPGEPTYIRPTTLWRATVTSDAARRADIRRDIIAALTARPLGAKALTDAVSAATQAVNDERDAMAAEGLLTIAAGANNRKIISLVQVADVVDLDARRAVLGDPA